MLRIGKRMIHSQTSCEDPVFSVSRGPKPSRIDTDGAQGFWSIFIVYSSSKNGVRSVAGGLSTDSHGGVRRYVPTNRGHVINWICVPTGDYCCCFCCCCCRCCDTLVRRDVDDLGMDFTQCPRESLTGGGVTDAGASKALVDTVVIIALLSHRHQ
jgi:hypothetical protein